MQALILPTKTVSFTRTSPVIPNSINLKSPIEIKDRIQKPLRIDSLVKSLRVTKDPSRWILVRYLVFRYTSDSSFYISNFWLSRLKSRWTTRCSRALLTDVKRKRGFHSKTFLYRRLVSSNPRWRIRLTSIFKCKKGTIKKDFEWWRRLRL